MKNNTDTKNNDIVKNKNYYVKEVNPKTARELIKKYHYSGKSVPNSQLHLGGV